ncbi:MAG: tetratricopeptide repeat protein [Spirochaetota bacterium]
MSWFRAVALAILANLLLHPLYPQSGAAQVVEMTDAVGPLEQEQADLAISLAHSLAREKRYSEALQAYNEFLRVFHGNLRSREARESMARIYEKRQRYDLAIRQYDALYRELGISQLGLAYRLETARLQEMSGDEAAAAAIYREINQLDPGSDAGAKARTRMEALNLMQKTANPADTIN